MIKHFYQRGEVLGKELRRRFGKKSPRGLGQGVWFKVIRGCQTLQHFWLIYMCRGVEFFLIYLYFDFVLVLQHYRRGSPGISSCLFRLLCNRSGSLVPMLLVL